MVLLRLGPNLFRSEFMLDILDLCVDLSVVQIGSHVKRFDTIVTSPAHVLPHPKNQNASNQF